VASDNIDCLLSADAGSKDAGSKEVASLEVPAGNNDGNNDACSEVPTDNNAEAAALADTSLGSVEVASGKLDTILLIYLFIHSLYSLIMLTRSENRTLGAGAAAVAVAADVAFAEASLELTPANNPANAAALADPSLGSVEVALDNIDCFVSLDAGSKEVASLEVPAGNNDAVFADAGLEVTAVDNNADAAADASLAGEVASMEAPPADNNALAAADASLAGEAASMEAPPADNNIDAANADAAAADASDVELEFDWQPVSILKLYEFTYTSNSFILTIHLSMNSLIFEFTYMKCRNNLSETWVW
jgi:hypothetical protein